VTATEILPAAFADLADLVPGWTIATMAVRSVHATNVSDAERRSFHSRLAPRFEAVMEYLSGVSMTDLSPKDERLLRLALSHVEVALLEEVYTPEARAMHLKSVPLISVPHEIDHL
jgi:hypothetical protein